MIGRRGRGLHAAREARIVRARSVQLCLASGDFVIIRNASDKTFSHFGNATAILSVAARTRDEGPGGGLGMGEVRFGGER